jgi:hypothetical protein
MKMSVTAAGKTAPPSLGDVFGARGEVSPASMKEVACDSSGDGSNGRAPAMKATARYAPGASKIMKGSRV